MSGHEHWEELAAGYALDAIEPDERDEFIEHLATCAQCRTLVDEHLLVAAQLGSLAGDDVAPPPWSDIRAGVITSPTPSAGGDVVVLHRRRMPAVLTAAAAAVVLLGAGAAWQLTRSSGAQPLDSAQACRQTADCHVIALDSAVGPAAQVLVHHGQAAIVPTSMPPLPSGSVWALWQLPRGGAPVLLTEFATGSRSTLKVGYGQTAGFAVSRETAGTTPVAPSDVIAAGNVA